jgi:hypothetical protein
MSLLLGPVLRRVVGDTATVWVQTTEAATVEVQAGPGHGKARTFSAYGRHFALVVVTGLAPEAVTPYQVSLDGAQVWPPAEYPYPGPVIRTRGAEGPVRLVFGSCREANPYTRVGLPPDALDAYASRLARTGGDWPDCLMLLGDQVYADMISPITKRALRARWRHRVPASETPEDQVLDFTEYAALYLESWSDPEVRWLLSTVPSMMIFDDHEVIDDWNTSATWRADMAEVPWWSRRIRAGLASYWIFQHLGNLDPEALDADPVYAAVTACASVGDATEALRAFGRRADEERDSYRWSYTATIGDTRIVVLDNRCGRQLEPGHRRMLPPAEWDWFTGLVRQGGYRHLVIGASLPWLLPPGVQHLEAAVERLAESPRRPVAASAEWLRRALDLEHWAAFGDSFAALTRLLTEVASGTDRPASVSVLSGDVHHSYATRPDLGPAARTPVHQLTCSPVHNRVPAAMRPVLRFGWGRAGAATGRGLLRLAGLPRPALRWNRLAGPYFGNAVGTVVHDGQSARVVFEGTEPDGRLVRLADVPLT